MRLIGFFAFLSTILIGCVTPPEPSPSLPQPLDWEFKGTIIDRSWSPDKIELRLHKNGLSISLINLGIYDERLSFSVEPIEDQLFELDTHYYQSGDSLFQITSMFEMEGVSWHTHGMPQSLEITSIHQDPENRLYVDGHFEAHIHQITEPLRYSTVSGSFKNVLVVEQY